jgi:PAS domain S-box-containing protein
MRRWATVAVPGSRCDRSGRLESVIPDEGRADAWERLFQLSSDAVFVDVEGRIAAVNQAGVRLYGCEDAEQLVGRSTEELVPDDLRSHIAGRAGRRRDGVEQDRWAREEILRVDGTVTPVEARTAPVTWEGRPAVLVLLRDRSGQARAEAALAARSAIEELVAQVSFGIGTAADEVLDAAIESVLGRLARHDGADRAYVIIFDEEGRRIFNTHEWVAEGVQRQIGYVQDLRTADFPWSVGVLRRGQAVHLPDMDTVPDAAGAEAASFGRYGVRSVLQVPMMAGGRLVGLVGFNHVRSARTWPQETIDLLRTVGDLIATAMLRRRAAEEAARAVEAAMAASRAKDEFLSRMSHELRTPLNAILGFSELLQDEAADGDRRAHVDRIVAASRHLRDLVEDVLDISRIESDRLPVRLDVVDASALCREAADMVQETAAAHGVSLRVQERPGTVLWADPTRARQTVLNVLTNAVKYNAPGGSAQVSIESGPGVVDIVVVDDGPGIAPDRLGRVFEPFDRLGAEVSGVEGSGIGLTLVRRLMGLMGGDVTIDSRPGSGTRVRLTFPVAEPSAIRRVLVVDEDALVRNLVAAVLSTGRVEVRTSVAVPDRVGPDGPPDLVLVGADHPSGVEALAASVGRVLPAATVVGMCGVAGASAVCIVGRPPDPSELRALLAD